MRFIGLDVHRDFCEVAICLPGDRARSAGRLPTEPEKLKLFAESLDRSDRVVMESTSNALAIARVLEGACRRGRRSPTRRRVRAISHAKVKSDQLRRAHARGAARRPACCRSGVGRGRADARAAAAVLAAARRASCASGRASRTHDAPRRCSATSAWTPRPRVTCSARRAAHGLSGSCCPRRRRRRCRALCATLASSSGEVAALDQEIAKQALARPGFHRLLTIPGVDVGTAAAVIAAVGEIERFSSLWAARRLSRPRPKGSASQALSQRAMGTFQSAATRKHGRCSSRLLGERSAPPARSERLASE